MHVRHRNAGAADMPRDPLLDEGLGPDGDSADPPLSP